jgi:hypothetical protein
VESFEIEGRIDEGGKVKETMQLGSSDGAMKLGVPDGTSAVSAQGKPLKTIDLRLVEEPPIAPETNEIIGHGYDLGPDGSTFNPPLSLTLYYDPSLIPEDVNEENLTIAYYDEGKNQWIEMNGEVDVKTKTVTTLVSHFTLFAVVGKSMPASFAISNVTLSSSDVLAGEYVTISAEVSNTGGLRGQHTVELRINGVIEATRDIELDAGASDIVSFTVSQDIPGSYSVEIEGQELEFAVTAQPHANSGWKLITGTVAVSMLVGLASVFVVVRRKRTTVV